MITIDNNLRMLNIPKTEILGVVGDENINIIEFEMPREYKGIDLSGYKIQIKFKNVERGGLKFIEGNYNPPNIVFNDEKINFYWVVSSDACKYRGKTEFSVFLEKDKFKFNTKWAALPVYEKQFPEAGRVKDNELLEIYASKVKISVENEMLIMSPDQ